MRNVLVLTGERPLHFTRPEADRWVCSTDAEWQGQGHKRIKLTPKGRVRCREIKAVLKVRGFSAIVGETIALSKEPWARAFVSQQLRRPEREKVNREIS